MRTKLNRKGRVSLPIAAALVLAIIFTFNACSGDANMSCLLCETGSISDLPKQLYLNGEKFNGNGDLMIVYEGCREESVPAGRIQNGQIALDLPENNTKCMFDISYIDDHDSDLSCSGNYSYTKNVKIAAGSVFAVIPGYGICELALRGGSSEYAFLGYFSASGKLTGTKRCVYKNGSSDTEKPTYDWNFSKGWNILYGYDKCNYNECETYNSTDPKIIKGSLEWHCRGG